MRRNDGWGLQMKEVWGLLVGVGLLCVPLSNAQARNITQEERRFCAQAYHQYCGEYGLDSAALRDCMDRNGRYLTHSCVEALIDAGEVSRSEVERRRKSGK